LDRFIRTAKGLAPSKSPQGFLIKPALNTPNLDISGFVNHPSKMHSIKISSKVDEDTWNELKALASETHQNLSGLLTEAIREYVTRKRVRPVVMNHLDQSIAENEELGKLLAQ
jgi:predicted transcriptional regulator